MARKPVKYCLVDTFTETAFKGNPSAACLLEEEKDVGWLSGVAREFNQAVTSFLTQLKTADHSGNSDRRDIINGSDVIPKFRLRWFTRDGDEIPLCGHATLAASHFLLTRVVPNSNVIELSTLFGPMIARRVSESMASSSFSTELNLPSLSLVEHNDFDIPTISKFLNGAPIVEIKMATLANYLFVVLPSARDVEAVEPHIDAIQRYPVNGVIVTARAPPGSKFDVYVRFFCPNMGADEDHVCGSCHCALGPYWSEKLGKHDFVSYQASKRSGVINVQMDEKNQRVLVRGKAVAVVEGSLLV